MNKSLCSRKMLLKERKRAEILLSIVKYFASSSKNEIGLNSNESKPNNSCENVLFIISLTQETYKCVSSSQNIQMVLQRKQAHTYAFAYSSQLMRSYQANDEKCSVRLRENEISNYEMLCIHDLRTIFFVCLFCSAIFIEKKIVEKERERKRKRSFRYCINEQSTENV